jgi:signal peptidase I
MSKAKATVPAPEPAKPAKSQDGARETFESIVVAFVLAFLFRTFIAEAFVIPTGSMAPTLFGRHKDAACPQCGEVYEVGASEELDDDGSILLRRITHSTCPNCRHEFSIKDDPVYKGDRILVNKFPYEIGDPQRWDVCVFKFPEIPERNYIKRLIGLPGEAIRLDRGDVYTRAGTAGDFRIQRKADPNKQDVLQILVYNDAHPPRQLLEKGWPERWAAMTAAAAEPAGWRDAPASWTVDPQTRTYELKAPAVEPQWLRYRHLVPHRDDWKALEEGLALNTQPRPTLVTDYYGYNSFSRDPRDDADDDVYWVGDLTVSGELEVTQAGPDATVTLELVEGVRRYRCTIALKTGEATLSHNDELSQAEQPVVLGTVKTGWTGTGRHRFRFANVDDRLCLWIDGRLVAVPNGGEYVAPSAGLVGPQPSDLMPVGIAVQGAAAKVSDLLLRRDIYYRAERVADDARFAEKASLGEELDGFTRNKLRDELDDPVAYARLYNEKLGPVEFAPLQSDEYFVMGDNSPRSQDSRLWTNRRGAFNRHAVPRHAFVGKAFLIYWPHGVPFMNDGKGYPIVWHSVPKNIPVENYPAYTAPFYPQFGRWLSRIR